MRVIVWWRRSCRSINSRFLVGMPSEIFASRCCAPRREVPLEGRLLYLKSVPRYLKRFTDEWIELLSIRLGMRGGDPSPRIHCEETPGPRGGETETNSCVRTRLPLGKESLPMR